MKKSMPTRIEIEIKDLTPELWPDLEKLFGPNGACGGCWCMAWRLERGERWGDIKGPVAKGRFEDLVKSGKAQGALAFIDGEPVGWCAYGPRLDFARLSRARTLACDDAERVWSVPCFFIKARFRGMGIAGALLKHATASMKRRGVKIVEGYPVKPHRDDQPIPAAFAWTGTPSLFAAAGFRIVGNEGGAKQRVRKIFR